MTMIVTLRCQGKHGRCTHVLVRVTRNSRVARNDAIKAGWTCPPEGATGEDRCPRCSPTGTPACRRCASVMPFADALGHDNTGHRAANVLNEIGVRTWRALMNLEPGDLADTPGIGPKCRDRIREVQRGVVASRKKAA